MKGAKDKSLELRGGGFVYNMWVLVEEVDNARPHLRVGLSKLVCNCRNEKLCIQQILLLTREEETCSQTLSTIFIFSNRPRNRRFTDSSDSINPVNRLNGAPRLGDGSVQPIPDVLQNRGAGALETAIRSVRPPRIVPGSTCARELA